MSARSPQDLADVAGPERLRFRCAGADAVQEAAAPGGERRHPLGKRHVVGGQQGLELEVGRPQRFQHLSRAGEGAQDPRRVTQRARSAASSDSQSFAP